ncbi:MAG: hypothetical protein ABI297_02890 [Ginsengibacter sp.]
MYKFWILIFLLFSIQQFSFGQETLPNITVTQLGKRVLVSWNNPFTNVTNINVQRSGDSLKNFRTIGSLLDFGVGVNGFTDPKEYIPSNQYYRLFISFEGGSYMFSRSHRPALDTLNKTSQIEIPDVTGLSDNPRNLFIPSPHVYTGKDNNIIISLPNALHKKYSIRFYRIDGTFLFDIKSIKDHYLTLDKANFLHSGLYIFELYDNHIIIERHKFFIPKDGKPMPPMDIQGYPIR